MWNIRKWETSNRAFRPWNLPAGPPGLTAPALTQTRELRLRQNPTFQCRDNDLPLWVWRPTLALGVSTQRPACLQFPHSHILGREWQAAPLRQVPPLSRLPQGLTSRCLLWQDSRITAGKALSSLTRLGTTLAFWVLSSVIAVGSSPISPAKNYPVETASAGISWAPGNLG